jgi:hypothetical protein
LQIVLNVDALIAREFKEINGCVDLAILIGAVCATNTGKDSVWVYRYDFFDKLVIVVATGFPGDYSVATLRQQLFHLRANPATSSVTKEFHFLFFCL